MSTDATAPEHRNNFDLIRLFAASEVVLTHCRRYLGLEMDWIAPVTRFPGVPIFFFVSGFLIYQSWVNLRGRHQGKTFAINRVLRLYPALIVCFFVALASVFATAYPGIRQASFPQLAAWAAAQLSVAQVYNPDFMRAYGVGVLNGSLWSVVVELQFYLLTPLVCLLLQRGWRSLCVAWCLLLVPNLWNSFFVDGSTTGEKLFAVSFLPWLYMFVTGAIVSAWPETRQRILRTPWWLLLVAYLGVYEVSIHLQLGVSNAINPLAFLLLAALVVKAAFSGPWLADRVLRRNDISYGLYIFHMPVVNFMVFSGRTGQAAWLVATLAAVVALAFASWRLVERPSLGMKKVALRRLT